MKLAIIAFTARGLQLGKTLAAGLTDQGDQVTVHKGFGPQRTNLRLWTKEAFQKAEGLVFIGACGIAVRAIAPYVQAKDRDPAVLVVDEKAQFVIPVLSGHLGGANALASRLSQLTGAQAVITTATDLNNAWAVDLWAKKQGCVLANPEKIKTISSRILAGKEVLVRTQFPIEGTPPAHVALAKGKEYDILLSIRTKGKQDALRLIPPIAMVGIGCKKGVSGEEIETAWQALLAKGSVDPRAVAGVCSIDLKKNEEGILSFCRHHQLPFYTFSAAELEKAEGTFTSSAFVKSITGVDNVCERSAVLGSKGTIYLKKNAGNGVTMAMALAPFSPSWEA